MTNQNDTQDEAERMAINKIAGDVNLLTKIHCLEIPEVALALKKAYRAGVSSKEPEIASLKHDLATKSSTDLISEKYRLREQLAASRAEVERLKKALYSTEESSAEQYQRAQIHKEQLAAEKQKAQKLVEALEYYADEKNWYPVNEHGHKMVISSIDTRGQMWIGGFHAEQALKDYSTDSGDGGEK